MLDDISISHGFEDPVRWWHVERMTMFTDAMFSIIATVSIVTIKLDDETMSQEDFNLKAELISCIPKYVAYFGGFFVISTYWGCHVRLYNLITNSNDVLTWLNLILLCVLSFLPLTLSLWSSSKNYKEATQHFPAINLLLSACIMTLTIFYAFRDRAAHHTTVTNSQKKQQRLLILVYAWVPTLIGLMCVYVYKLQEFVMCIVFVLIILTYIVIAKFEDWYFGKNIIEIAVQQIHSTLPKDRIEAFSDGVYAISMTLLAVQTAEKMAELKDTSEEFFRLFGNFTISYVTAYGLTSVLWFIHHQLFNNIERSNPVIQTLNTLAVSFVGGVPFSSSLIRHYVNPANFNETNYVINERSSVQFHCLVLFFSGIFQALLWLAALVMRCTKVSLENYSDVLLLFKAMVVPVFSCTVFISSMFTVHSSLIFLALTLFTPFLFAIANYAHRARIFQCFRRLLSQVCCFTDVESLTNNGLLETSTGAYDEPLMNANSPPMFSYTDRRSNNSPPMYLEQS